MPGQRRQRRRCDSKDFRRRVAKPRQNFHKAMQIVHVPALCLSLTIDVADSTLLIIAQQDSRFAAESVSRDDQIRDVHFVLQNTMYCRIQCTAGYICAAEYNAAWLILCATKTCPVPLEAPFRLERCGDSAGIDAPLTSGHMCSPKMRENRLCAVFNARLSCLPPQNQFGKT